MSDEKINKSDQASSGQELPAELEQLLEDPKTSNIKKDKKEFYYQLIKNLSELEGQYTTETVK